MTTLNHTIPQVLVKAAQQWPDHTAIQDGDTKLSYTDLLAKAKQCGAAMITSGLQPEDRFAIWAPNIHEWVWTAVGGMMAGGILVPLNTRYRGIEAGDILSRAEAQLLFTTNGFLDTDYPNLLKGEQLPTLKQTILLRGDGEQTSIADFLSQANDDSLRELEQRSANLSGDAISDILFTSGTTGLPKGVMSTHAQTVTMFDSWSSTIGMRQQDRYLIVNPFFHSFGYKAGWLASMIRGATALPMAVFSPEQTLSIIEQEQISILPGAPTIFQTMLNSPALADTDTTSLRCAVTGAASVPEQLVHDMKQQLGFNEVFTAYGLTECPVVSITRAGDELSLIANTAGRALDNSEIAILLESGEQAPDSEVGNIMVRGYNVMQGYFNNEQATVECLNAEGWLDTGDLGWKDENGYVKVTDRAKDMYISGGFNCYPAEIENLLLRHPNIIDVAVTGAPDERLGETGHAYIVTDKPDMAHADLTLWAREHMANFKVPRQFMVVNELPRNASGKVMKFLLADIAEQLTLA